MVLLLSESPEQTFNSNEIYARLHKLVQPNQSLA